MARVIRTATSDDDSNRRPRNGRNGSSTPGVDESRAHALPVLLIEPSLLNRESLATLLADRAPDFQVGTLPTMTEASAVRAERPRVVVVCTRTTEVSHPNVTGGLEHLRRQWPDVPALMLSELNDDPASALEAVRSGWQGFFSASLEVELLVAAIRLVGAGGVFIPPRVIHAYALHGASASRS